MRVSENSCKYIIANAILNINCAMNNCLPKEEINHEGQMLLGILISVGVFAILIHALFSLVASSYDLVNFNRARITARHLAQEKIELTRNLPIPESTIYIPYQSSQILT